MIKGIIFDLDGTLLNTIDDLTISLNNTYKYFSYAKNNSTSDTMKIVGHGMKNLIKDSFPDKDEDYVNEALKIFLEYYDKQYMINTKPYVGISELIEELINRNILIGVNSNKNDLYTKNLISKNFSKVDMKFVYGIKKGDKPKPDPTNVYEIINKMKLNNNEILYIGDSQTDFKTANNANINFIGVSWGFREKQELIDEGVKIIVDKPKEILNYIE